MAEIARTDHHTNWCPYCPKQEWEGLWTLVEKIDKPWKFNEGIATNDDRPYRTSWWVCPDCLEDLRKDGYLW